LQANDYNLINNLMNSTPLKMGSASVCPVLSLFLRLKLPGITNLLFGGLFSPLRILPNVAKH